MVENSWRERESSPIAAAVCLFNVGLPNNQMKFNHPKSS
jgi:hypothetical protein